MAATVKFLVSLWITTVRCCTERHRTVCTMWPDISSIYLIYCGEVGHIFTEKLFGLETAEFSMTMSNKCSFVHDIPYTVKVQTPRSSCDCTIKALVSFIVQCRTIGQRAQKQLALWSIDWRNTSVVCMSLKDPYLPFPVYWLDCFKTVSDDYMRLVHLKTGHFGEKMLTSYMVLFLITRTTAHPLWSSLVCDILIVVHTFNLRHERASSSKYFQRSDWLNYVIWKPAVVLVFKWTSLIWSLSIQWSKKDS